MSCHQEHFSLSSKQAGKFIDTISVHCFNSNSVKPLEKGQRDLGWPLRVEGASLFFSPNFPFIASMT